MVDGHIDYAKKEAEDLLKEIDTKIDEIRDSNIYYPNMPISGRLTEIKAKIRDYFEEGIDNG